MKFIVFKEGWHLSLGFDCHTYTRVSSKNSCCFFLVEWLLQKSIHLICIECSKAFLHEKRKSYVASTLDLSVLPTKTLFNGEISPNLTIVCFGERSTKSVQRFNKIEMEQVGNTERNSTPLSVIPLISAKTTKCEWCITSHLSHLKLEQLYPPSFSNFMTLNEKVNIVGSNHLRKKELFPR